MSRGAALAGGRAPTDTMVPVPHRVVERHVEVVADPASTTDEVVTLDLAPEGDRLGRPAPGQFAMVWAPGVGEVPISFSAVRDDLLSVTIRAVGATTTALCDARPGSVLGLRGPFGNGWSPVDPDRPVVVVTGGIGLAPLRHHIESLLAERRDRARSGLTLVIGARTPAEIPFREQVDDWSGRCEVHLTVERPDRSWQGDVGLVTAALARVRVTDRCAVALCGPEIMMRVAARDAVAAGADPRRVEVSLERSMACAVAHCGRCQLGPVLLCRDGPVLGWQEADALTAVRRW